MNHGILASTDVQAALASDGFSRIDGADMLALLGADGLAWRDFSHSWDDLGPDLYMADGGRYRRRRHATFRLHDGAFTRQAHQPHFQSRDYNRLNGDVQRWFEPVAPETADNTILRSIFAFCARSFDPADARSWHVEMHQFRIETQEGHIGRPTPEGLHRDGVDRVFVMLIERRNVREGVTRIGAPGGTPLGEFMLTKPGDTVLIDDYRILHGVTEIHAVDPALPAWRDALVVTFAAET
ncbi:MAG TPA: 2OG-Fe dioxygenase family protein [Sphingobium sp.]